MKKPKTIIQAADIGKFANGARTSSDEEKYDVLVNTWTPDSSYVFPKVIQSGRSRFPPPNVEMAGPYEVK